MSQPNKQTSHPGYEAGGHRRDSNRHTGTLSSEAIL